MKKGLLRIRGALVMALTWALLWGIVGAMMGALSGLLPAGNALEEALDPWLALIMPGFIGGILFSIVLWFMEPEALFYTLSKGRLALLGAIAGAVMGRSPMLLGSVNPPYSAVTVGAIMFSTSTILCTASALVSAWVFRLFKERPPAEAELAG